LITISTLTTQELIEEACSLLYKVYIEHGQWNFLEDNPSKLRIEYISNRKLLVDRFTHKAIWFGAFNSGQLVGCIRLCGIDEDNKFEIEGYSSSQTVWHNLPPLRSSCMEMTKLAVNAKDSGQGIARRLLLAAFQYCEKHKLSVFTCTHNGYLKSLYSSIEYPLKMEFAFKYEPQDEIFEEFYFANYQSNEVNIMIGKLKYLERSSKINKHSILELLEIVAPVLPAPVYWHDVNGTVLGINEHCLKAIGTSREIVGKTPYEFYPEEIAAHILTHNKKVMRTEQILSQEEYIRDITTQEEKYFSAIKAPLYDSEGNVIGIVGTSIDITAEKETERLKLENERLKFESLLNIHQAIKEEQEKFKKIVSQMVHDIQSPLASLRVMISESLKQEPEETRVSLRHIANNISDITTNVLNAYKNDGSAESEQKQEEMLVSDSLFQVLGEKRIQFKEKPGIKFETSFTLESNFDFIKIVPSHFKRAISNIINNAVEALKDETGVIELTLNSNAEQVIIAVIDNGKGMSRETLDKLRNGVAITAGKSGGHGIGFTQVRDMVEQNNGEIIINSNPACGTTVVLKFPKIQLPRWICPEVNLKLDDTIVVLDDDSSIHDAWDARFAPLRVKFPQLKVKHFKVGAEVISYLNSLSKVTEPRICLLSDYELLNQDVTGIEVIQQSEIKNSVLVTSHFADPKVRREVIDAKAKLLPKELVFAVPIKVDKKLKPGSKKVDMVWVDDHIGFAEFLIKMYYPQLSIDKYADPRDFLEDVVQYPLDTKIILDLFYYESDEKTWIMDGLAVADILYSKGYTKLFLVAGEMPQTKCIPAYLTVILKNDEERIKQLHRL
jgi:PAS domain S-box-containing protein